MGDPKNHHSAETMTPITVYRTHPLEGILFSLRSAIVQGTTMAVCLFLFGNAVDLYAVLGVNVMSFIFHVTGSNLRHSHISIRYWPWLEHILISPAQHQVHHSIARASRQEIRCCACGLGLAVWLAALVRAGRGSEIRFATARSASISPIGRLPSPLCGHGPDREAETGKKAKQHCAPPVRHR